MNQEKIGKFIAECRKEKELTQEQLAEKLYVSNRAVSKWERGLNLPDTSIMLDLCNILDITVNELLSGEIIKKDKYMEKAEDNLIKLKEQEEKYNKMLFELENVLGVTSLISYMLMIFAGSFAVTNIYWRITLIGGALLLLIISVIFAVKIEAVAGYYVCKNCNHHYVPTYFATFMAMHNGRTRYLKCPKCGKRTWNKKVLTK